MENPDRTMSTTGAFENQKPHADSIPAAQKTGTAGGGESADLLAVLERIAQALETGNERLQDVVRVVACVSDRIEDVGGFL